MAHNLPRQIEPVPEYNWGQRSDESPEQNEFVTQKSIKSDKEGSFKGSFKGSPKVFNKTMGSKESFDLRKSGNSSGNKDSENFQAQLALEGRERSKTEKTDKSGSKMAGS